MKHRVQKSTRVPIGQHKTITVCPLWVGGRKSHDFVKQSMSHGSAAHRSTGVSTVCFLYDVGTQATNGIDAGGIDGRRHFLFFLRGFGGGHCNERCFLGGIFCWCWRCGSLRFFTSTKTEPESGDISTGVNSYQY